MYSTPENSVKDVRDLFGNRHIPLKGKISRRSELIGYFYDNALATWKGKKPLTHGFIAFRLGHLSLFDLEAFRSQCEDRKRKGDNWSKYFWGVLKEVGRH